MFYILLKPSKEMLSLSLFVRVHSPAQDPTLPDDTIIFIVGALNVPAGKAGFIKYVDSRAERNERN